MSKATRKRAAIDDNMNQESLMDKTGEGSTHHLKKNAKQSDLLKISIWNVNGLRALVTVRYAYFWLLSILRVITTYSCYKFVHEL